MNFELKEPDDRVLRDLQRQFEDADFALDHAVTEEEWDAAVSWKMRVYDRIESLLHSAKTER